MNKEVEIRVIIKDFKKAEERLLNLGKFVKSRKQIDKYYYPKNHNFYAREPIKEYLRIRREKGGHHLNYSYCHLEKDGSLISTDEYETLTSDPEVLEKIFARIDMVHKITVTKIRKYFVLKDFEVVLDYIKELGYFMEIEAKKDFGGEKKTKEKCFELLDKLNIDYKKSPEMGYPTMVMRARKT